MYEDDADELVDGCECGSTLFLYQKEGEERELDTSELKEEKKSVMDEIDKFLRDVKSKVRPGKDFAFDLQSITVQEDGVYEIDVRKLLEEIPLIVEIKDGEYRLHLASVFSRGKEKGLRLQDLDLDEEVNTVSENVEQFSGDMEDVTDDVDSLGDAVDGIEEEIEELREGMTGEDVGDRIGDMEEEIEDLRTWQEQIKQTFGG